MTLRTSELLLFRPACQQRSS